MEISINLEPCDFSFFFSSLFIVDERLAARLGTWLNLIEKRREFGLVNRVYRRGCKHDVTTCQLNQPKWCRRALKHWWTQRPWKLRISEAVYVLELIWFFFFCFSLQPISHSLTDEQQYADYIRFYAYTIFCLRVQQQFQIAVYIFNAFRVLRLSKE